MADSGAVFYGASWCPHCQEQKALFGASQDRLPYVECSPGGPRGGVASSCLGAGVQTYPTWVFPDGSRLTAVMSLRELADRVGYRHASEGGKQGRRLRTLESPEHLPRSLTSIVGITA